jgi:hypothetical protein
MCEFCGSMKLDPEVAKLWEAEREKLTPELRAYIDHAADMLKEEIKKAQGNRG